MSGRIRVIAERLMSRGYEPRVARLMENVKAKVAAQPGVLSVETFIQVDDSHKYVVFSEWESRKAYDRWIASAEFHECTDQINELLDVPGIHTRIFMTPQENIFLL